MEKKQYLNLHEQLIRECGQGNRKSQFELYKLYYKAMYNASLRIVKNEGDAEDIMQESFLKAFQSINTYKAEVSFGAWLRKIVVNRSLDFLRKRKIEIFPLENEPDLMIEDENQEEKEFDEKTRIEEVLKEINRLPDGYRIILTLYLLEGYDHDEIAEILKISSSTSRSQYLRAKKRLLNNIKLKK